jgi:hypothetical protein
VESVSINDGSTATEFADDQVADALTVTDDYADIDTLTIESQTDSDFTTGGEAEIPESESADVSELTVQYGDGQTEDIADTSLYTLSSDTTAAATTGSQQVTGVSADEGAATISVDNIDGDSTFGAGPDTATVDVVRNLEPTLSFPTVAPNEDFDATVSVANNGNNEASSVDAEVTLQGTTQTAFNGETIAAGESATNDALPFTAPSATGTYDITLNYVVDSSTSPSEVTANSPRSVTGTLNVEPVAGQQSPIEYVYQGSVAFQGQDVFAVNLPGENTLSTGDTDYEIRSADAFDNGVVDDSSFVEESDVVRAGDELSDDQISYIDDNSERDFDADSAVVEFETDDRDAGTYYLDGPGLPEEGTLQRSSTFEIALQDLDAVIEEDDLPVLSDDRDDSLAELELSSDRGTYSLNVSADGDLDEEELFNLFTYSAVVEDFQVPEDEREADNLANALKRPPSTNWSMKRRPLTFSRSRPTTATSSASRRWGTTPEKKAHSVTSTSSSTIRAKKMPTRRSSSAM